MSDYPIIRNRFINKKGIQFDNVKEVAFSKESLNYNLGKYITETKYDEDDYFHDDNYGVYIYQNRTNPNIGYRIYKEYASPGFDGYKDDYLIDQLSLKQKNVKETDFPTGIVSLDGSIIGQEIVYYDGYLTLLDYIEKNMGLISLEKICKILNKILERLEELYINGVLYLDIHAKNFMISDNLKGKLQIKITDFDYYYIRLDSFSEIDINSCINNLKLMFAHILIKLNFDTHGIMKRTMTSFGDFYVYISEFITPVTKC